MKKTEFIEGVCTLIERYVPGNQLYNVQRMVCDLPCGGTVPICKGRRLNEQALSVRVGGINIYEWTTMSVKQTIEFMKQLELTQRRRTSLS